MTGKKGRPAVCLSVARDRSGLVVDGRMDPGAWDDLRRALPVLGSAEAVGADSSARETPEGPLTYKVGLAKDGDVLKEKPEFEEVRRIWEKPKA